MHTLNGGHCNNISALKNQNNIQDLSMIMVHTFRTPRWLTMRARTLGLLLWFILRVLFPIGPERPVFQS